MKIEENFETEREGILRAIKKVARGDTDFYEGFEKLFRFMAANPGSETTDMFLDFHITDKNSPLDDNGKPCFTYLIGEYFITDEWVDEEDMKIFEEFPEI